LWRDWQDGVLGDSAFEHFSWAQGAIACAVIRPSSMYFRGKSDQRSTLNSHRYHSVTWYCCQESCVGSIRVVLGVKSLHPR
jgi:hypothetical protein